MTFVGFLRFALKLFNVLAWPLCSLGYPLCASISAIESNSSKDIQNLVTYWVSFSLISLFDHAFGKLLYWNPLWPYMKLLAICWLALPDFDGSLYVYKHVVHPFVSETPKLVMDWFSAWKKIVLYKAAEIYIQVNGAEAFEKFFANKPKCAKPNFDIKEVKAVGAIEKNRERPEYKEPSISQNEIKKVEVTEKKEVAAAKWTECKEASIAQNEIKKDVTEKKEAAPAAAAKWVKKSEVSLSHIQNKGNAAAVIEGASVAVKENKLPEMPAIKTVQKEWTCALCQVTAPNETALNAHLQGRRHTDKIEELKEKQAAKKKGSSASMTTNSDQPKVKPKKFVPPDLLSKHGGSSNQINSSKKEGKIQPIWINKQSCQIPTKSIDINQSRLWCSICDVTCTSDHDMDCHLKGRKHLANAQELPAFVGYVGTS